MNPKVRHGGSLEIGDQLCLYRDPYLHDYGHNAEGLELVRPRLPDAGCRWPGHGAGERRFS